jgi:hypothetical protein
MNRYAICGPYAPHGRGLAGLSRLIRDRVRLISWYCGEYALELGLPGKPLGAAEVASFLGDELAAAFLETATAKRAARSRDRRLDRKALARIDRALAMRGVPRTGNAGDPQRCGRPSGGIGRKRRPGLRRSWRCLLGWRSITAR